VQELAGELRIDVEYRGEVTESDLMKITVRDSHDRVARLAQGDPPTVCRTNHRLGHVLDRRDARRHPLRQVNFLQTVAEDVAFSCPRRKQKQ